MNLTTEEKMIVAAAEDYVRELFVGDSSGHDAEHTFRVYRNAMQIANGEPKCDLFVVALAALLHDADDYKLFQTENNANARHFMAAQKVPDELADRICEVINSVSFSKNKGKRPSTLEGCVVQDADRLDAIGAIGIARTFAFGGEKGRSMNDTVQHFYDKLLLLKDQMNTETARREAKSRHTYLCQFLAELDREREWARETGAAFEDKAEVSEENVDS